MDDDEDNDEEIGLDHTILCLFDKVTRVKNKWKCSFKDGVVMVNGKDFLFTKVSATTYIETPHMSNHESQCSLLIETQASGDFEW